MSATEVIDRTQARALPKVLLHDHLDGGLRPATIIELAADIGHELPSTDPDELVAFFRRGADAGDILQYLETFGHTVPLLQTTDALRRVARECAVDLAADGVVYAEVRFAPELHTGTAEQPIALDDAIEAVTAGFGEGCEAAALDPELADIAVNTIICAMRTESRSLEVAEACLQAVEQRLTDSSEAAGVVAFDLAGAETGFPPSDHAEALALIRASAAELTIHASEPPGLELIAGALDEGASRVGHGVRLIEDCEVAGDGTLTLGPLAQQVLEAKTPLELCPSCNVQIGAVPTLADHPIGPFLRAGIRATVNTDNRLMSGVSLSSEVADIAAAHALTLAEIEQLQHHAVDAAFITEQQRQKLHERITEGFRSLPTA